MLYDSITKKIKLNSYGILFLIFTGELKTVNCDHGNEQQNYHSHAKINKKIKLNYHFYFSHENI